MYASTPGVASTCDTGLKSGWLSGPSSGGAWLLTPREANPHDCSSHRPGATAVHGAVRAPVTVAVDRSV
jgi:hypothetical protein